MRKIAILRPENSTSLASTSCSRTKSVRTDNRTYLPLTPQARWRQAWQAAERVGGPFQAPDIIRGARRGAHGGAGARGRRICMRTSDTPTQPAMLGRRTALLRGRAPRVLRTVLSESETGSEIALLRRVRAEGTERAVTAPRRCASRRLP